MNSEDRELWIARYEERLKVFGVSPEALGWGGGRERQDLRFRTALEFLKFSSKPVNSILDVGCGFGDLGNWLIGHYPDIAYTGIDINPSLIDLGMGNGVLNLSTQPLETFEPKSFDLVVANGIFNYRMLNESHENYVEQMLSKLLSVSKVGIAVDFMSTHVEFEHENAFHCPQELIVNTIRNFTRRFVIRNDYLDFEFMAYAFL
jgi:trans-aconitate methyltransferase